MADNAKDLAEVLPFEEIKSYFGREVAREEFRSSELAMIAKYCRSDLFSLTLNCAIRAKQIYKPELDMIPLVPHIQTRNPLLLDKLTLLLGEDSLHDIYCCRCTVDEKTVASLLIAQVWPRDVYVGMVMFADPSKPIPVVERKSVLQKFRGLGLLSTFLERVESCARARGCQNITLVANETSQMTLFAKYGFAVDGYQMAAKQVAEGQAIPMHNPGIVSRLCAGSS